MPRKKSSRWKAIEKKLLCDQETTQAYRELTPEHELARQVMMVIKARQAQGLSQA